MNDSHLEITILAPDEELRNLLVARLDLLGYQGFEETDTDLKAYIPGAEFNEDELNEILQQYTLLIQNQ
jgi:ribosomal protein L11 methyltransferase